MPTVLVMLTGLHSFQNLFKIKVNSSHALIKFCQNLLISLQVMGLRSSTNQGPADILMQHGFHINF